MKKKSRKLRLITGNNRKKDDFPSIPLEIMREMERARGELADLIRVIREDVAKFKSAFKPELPSEMLYVEEYEKQKEELLFHYRRMSSILQKRDVKALEDCFGSMRNCKERGNHLDVLLPRKKEASVQLQKIKDAALDFFNGSGEKPAYEKAIKSVEEYLEEMSRLNKTEFEKIQEKEDEIIEKFNQMEKALGDYRRSLKSLKKYSEKSEKGDLLSGLINLKSADGQIQTLLNGGE